MTRTVHGPMTGVSLGQTEAFLHPWEMDPWGRMRPPVTVEALQMSAEMCAICHSLALKPWFRAGWRDVSVEVDGEITALEADETALTAKWQRQRLRQKIRGANPIQQLSGALREREAASTGKAVVMLHPASHGRYVVAVCFMGTGTRFYDWFSNFRIATPEGVHQGFGQICAQFEGNEDAILFPETAAELNLPRLSLRDILQEMKRASSRFTLWLCGHSQGGAVMQVYAHRKIMVEGVRAENVVGYGFASPSVMTAGALHRPDAYPLYHVFNSEDLVPRCGAQVHLGVCLSYEADGALRRACYAWPRDEEAVRARIEARPVVQQMTDTAGCIVQIQGLLRLLKDCGAAEAAEILGLGDNLPIGVLLEAVDVSALLDRLIRRMDRAYCSIMGEEVSEAEKAAATALMRDITARTGLRPFTSALLQLIRQPHRMSPRAGSDFVPAYIWIARNGLERLTAFHWESGAVARRVGLPNG